MIYCVPSGDWHLRRSNIKVESGAPKEEVAREVKPPAIPLQLTVGQRSWRAAMASSMAAGLVLLRFVNPAESSFSLSTPLTQRLFGLPCPFCGITRGTHELLNGEVMRALYLNMATGAVLGIAVLLILIWGIEAIRGKDWKQFSNFGNAVFSRWRLLLGCLLVFWVVHLSVAVLLPKWELLDPQAPFFPVFLLKESTQ